MELISEVFVLSNGDKCPLHGKKITKGRMESGHVFANVIADSGRDYFLLFKEGGFTHSKKVWVKERVQDIPVLLPKEKGFHNVKLEFGRFHAQLEYEVV
jgi:hypothetical protein